MVDYKSKIYQFKDDSGVYWVAEYPVLSGVKGIGETQLEALKDLENNSKVHLEVMEELGMEIPFSDALQTDSEYSGRITLRVSPLMHKEIAERAKQENVSMTSWLSNAISYRLGQQSGLNELSTRLDNILIALKPRQRNAWYGAFKLMYPNSSMNQQNKVRGYGKGESYVVRV